MDIAVNSCFFPSEGWGRRVAARCTSVLRCNFFGSQTVPNAKPRGTFGYRHTSSLYPKLVDLSRRFGCFCLMCLQNCNFVPLFYVYESRFWQFANKYERKLNRKSQSLSEKAQFRRTLFLKKGLLFRKVYGIISWYKQNIYPWHSWIARQTPTLKVEGSNPFG